MRTLEARTELKENMFNTQLRALEDQLAQMQSHLQAEKETFEEHYLSLKKEIENVTMHVNQLQTEN